MGKDRMSGKKDLIIFSNGPGEVSTWVLPIIDAFRKRNELAAQYRIVLIIHPDQFGSGTEHEVAGKFNGVSYVIRPREYMKLLITGLGKKKLSFKKQGLIFSLGGNLMHPVLFRKRIGGKHLLYAYTNNTGWEQHFEKIFVRNDYVRSKFVSRGVPENKVMITGDLVYSSLKDLKGKNEVRKELQLSNDERMVVFMPGSRMFEAKYMVPIFLKAINDITESVEHLKIFILKSPYISYEFVREALRFGGKIKEVESMPGELITGTRNGKYRIEFAGGKIVQILDKGLEYWGKGIDFAVTLPGTNTIELAYRNIPALVIAPLNKPELIPVEGTAGLLKWVPLIGKPILRMAVIRYIKKFPFASLPNLYTDEEIFPEIAGVIQTEDISRRVIQILGSGEEAEIKKRLNRFHFEHDPADLIVDTVWGSCG
jgi:lipid-A-disaccharide synthase